MPNRSLLLPAVVLCLLVAGCGSARVTLKARSGLEQQLLVRALERAVARLDLSRLVGKPVALDLFALTEDKAFAKEFVTARLEQRGVQVVADAAKADLRLKILASVLGVDRSETLLGVPAFTVAVVTVPELALFKWVRYQGLSEVEILVFDGRSDRFVDAVPAGVGKAMYDEFTVLILISFTRSDLDEGPGSSGR